MTQRKDAGPNVVDSLLHLTTRDSILHLAQVELVTHCFCVQNLVQRLQKEDFRLAAVHLVDAYHCGYVGYPERLP